ncbi:MAG: hypothetical protein QY320_08090 [Gammaproteobacteria bacterium]|nr:MAG: hypothetical protein QY320_08090 [Gammaproteobacteria bacterium]
MSSPDGFRIVWVKWKTKDYEPKARSIFDFVSRYENVKNEVVACYQLGHPWSTGEWRDYQYFVEELAKHPAIPAQIEKLRKHSVDIPISLTYTDAIKLIDRVEGAKPLTPTQIKRLQSYGENPDSYPTRADAKAFIAKRAEEEEAKAEEEERRKIGEWWANWARKGLHIAGDKPDCGLDELREFDGWVKTLEKKGVQIPLPIQITGEQFSNAPDLDGYFFDMHDAMLNLRDGDEIRRMLSKGELIKKFGEYLRELWASSNGIVDDEEFIRKHFAEVFTP